MKSASSQLLSYHHCRKLPIDEQDVAYIYEELYRSGRSTVPPHAVVIKPQLSRWDVRLPLSVTNCVILSPADLATLDAADGIGENVEWWNVNGKEGDGTRVSGDTVREVVASRRAEAREWARRFD